jgi:hypothetical protein
LPSERRKGRGREGKKKERERGEERKEMGIMGAHRYLLP